MSKNTNPMKEWRKKFQANGGKIIQLNLTPETVAVLNKFCTKHNVTISQAVIHAILTMD